MKKLRKSKSMPCLVTPASSSCQPSTAPPLPPKTLPPSSIEQAPSLPKPPPVDYEEEEEEDYGNISVFLSIINPTNIASWTVIDPNHLVDCELTYSPEFNLPPDLVTNYIGYRPVVFESNMYIIGGKSSLLYRHPKPRVKKPPHFLDKMFQYDVDTKCWYETWSFLNVARAFHQVLVIDKLIYVFGGKSAAGLDAHNWIEYYNLNDQRWILLPTHVPCYGSQFVSDELPYIDGKTYSSVLYKRGRQVLFFSSSNGFHTFNYVDNTWAFVKTRIDDFNSFGYQKVAIVQHILFCAFDSTIYVYDLRKKMVVSFHDFKNRLVGNRRKLYLFRGGIKTLLLLCWDVRRIETGEPKKQQLQNGINCYRFQIQNDSPESCGIRLFQDAHHFFVSQDGLRINDSFVVSKIPHRQPSTDPPPPSLPLSSVQQPPCLPKPPVPITKKISPPSSQPHGQQPTSHQPQLLSTEMKSIEQPLGHALSPPPPPLVTWAEFQEYGFTPPPSPPPDLLAAFSVEQHTLPNPPSPQPRPTSELEEYGNKSNYVSVKFVRIASWTMFFPHKGDCSKFMYIHEYHLPQHIEYYDAYIFAVCDSNLYLIGGETGMRYRGIPEYSDRMYMYNVTTKTWDQLSPRLNVARSRHQVVVVDKIIYVFGGRSAVELGDHNWMEYYDLNDQNDKSWKLRSIKLLPDMMQDPFSTVHYERGHEILLFCSPTGFCSFNYDDNTCKFIETVIDRFNNFCYQNVAIVEDMMFCPLYEIIYVYDLRKKMVVYEHTIEYTNTLKGCQGSLSLFRVGKKKLLLLFSDIRLDEEGDPEPELNCHTYEIQCPSNDSCDIRLIQESHQIIVSPLSEYISNFLLI